MTAITGFKAFDERGNPVRADAFGNNVAFACLECQHPVLAIVRDNQRGSDKTKTVPCPECQQEYYLSINPSAEKLIIRRLE